MSWIDDLNNSADIGTTYRFQPVMRQQAPIPSPKKKKGNFLTNLIPTATSIGGGAAGAAIGTALLPGIGTLLGAGLGSALGGGGGKVAENAVEGSKLTSGVAGEAALSGVLGAGPLRLGKAAIDTARGVKAGVGLADALKAGGQAGVDMSLTKAVGNKLTAAGNDLLVKQFRLTPKQLTNFQTKFGEDASQVIKRYGFKNAGDVTEKGIKPLKNQYDELVKGVSGTINFDDFAKAVEKRAAKLISSAAPDTQKTGLDLLDHLNALRLNYGKEGFKNGAALNKVKNDYDALVNYTEKQANPGKYTVNKHIADSAREVLNAQSPELGKTGQELSKLYQLSKNTLGQENLGRGSLPISLGNLPGVAAGSAAGGLPGAVVGFGANAVLNSPVGRRALATAALKAGEKISAKAAGSTPYGAKAIAGRIAPVGLAGALMSGQSDGNSIPMTAMSTNAATMPNTSSMINPSYSQNGDLSSSLSDQPTSPFDISNVETNLQKLVQSGASDKDVQNYLGIVSAITDLKAKAAPAQKALNSTQQTQVNNAASGLSDLQTIAQEIQNDPSVLIKDAIPGGGLARRLTGTNAYDAAKQNIVDVIARMRSGAAITQDEANRYMSLLPGATDTPQSATSKLQRLQSLLSSFANPQASSNTDLASALGM